jgi:hypothetical protein
MGKTTVAIRKALGRAEIRSASRGESRTDGDEL